MTVLFKPVKYLKEQDCCHPSKQPDARCRPIEVPEGQLQEIRKTNLARLACDNAEGIEYIQPQAFFNVRTEYVHDVLL
ncbi:unnamed protein product, partial [Iphiclides podalirius]